MSEHVGDYFPASEGIPPTGYFSNQIQLRTSLQKAVSELRIAELLVQASRFFKHDSKWVNKVIEPQEATDFFVQDSLEE